MIGRMARHVFAIAGKDLLLERRSKANLNALIFLAALILVTISFALGPSPSRLRAGAAGVLWVAIAFAGVLAFARSYQAESENGCFEGMLLAGAEPKAIYLGKLIATTLVMAVVEAVVIIAMGLLYNLSFLDSLPALALIAVLGTIGFAAVGVLYGRLTMSLRGREIMLPLLVFPILVPALLAAVKGSSLVLSASTSDLWLWMEVLAVFDVVFVTAGIITYESLCRDI